MSGKIKRELKLEPETDEDVPPKKRIKTERKIKTESKIKTDTKVKQKGEQRANAKSELKAEGKINTESDADRDAPDAGCHGNDAGSVCDDGKAWDIASVISVRVCVPVWASRNVVRLLDDGCSIPFIARYRREQTGDMEVQKIRDSCILLEELRAVKAKVKTTKQAILDQGKMTPALNKALSNAQTMDEVDGLFAPFKPGHKGSLAERAKTLGLEPLAESYMKGFGSRQMAQRYVNTQEKGLASIDEIMEGVRHIVADYVHKDSTMMEKVREVSSHGAICLHSTKARATKAAVKPGVKPEPAHKYNDYLDKNIPIGRIQPHQVLAINRGETHKILSVKVEIPGFLQKQIESCGWQRWRPDKMGPESRTLVQAAIDDAYSRLIQPQIHRLVRSTLTKSSEKASIDVFASNLKCLLLTSPLKGLTILAVDPGFKNGCKTAVISKTGQILATAIVYMHDHKANRVKERNKFEELLVNHRCDVVAIGNGVACRETEGFVSDVIQKKFPKLKYCIVSESGASIYSVSDFAQKELPDLDPSLRGAVSIGRRLLDPLAEFVKVEPKHLGVGQYQHDMPQKQLKVSLDSTIQECVSFVGVDINTCSELLLSHLSGLSAAKAKKLVEYRNTSGPFLCREQLMAVKGLGEKSYEQAVGFIRVHSGAGASGINKGMPQTDSVDGGVISKKGKSKKKGQAANYQPNPLDMTWIHPESYGLTNRLIDQIGIRETDLGQPGFIRAVQQYLMKHSLSNLAERLGCGEPTLKLITDALVRPLTYDLRDEFEKPLFRSGVKSASEIKVGDILTGKVSNVTHFGAFVDLGVEFDALIHKSKMTLENSRKYDLKLGERVEAKIENIEVDRKRIGARLIKVL